MTRPPGTPPPPGCWTTTCTPPGPPAGTSPHWTNPEGPAPPGRPPASAPPVSTPRQAAAWLEAERANLHAAAGYAAATARPLYAMSIPAAMDGFLQTRGYWDQGLVLHQAALAAARQAGDRPGQAHALMLLSPMQTMTEDTRPPPPARPGPCSCTATSATGPARQRPSP